jgi:aromatic ring hydroxylase
MPAKDFLDLEEKKNLQKALKEEERAEVRERILMFLLLNDGKTQRLDFAVRLSSPSKPRR